MARSSRSPTRLWLHLWRPTDSRSRRHWRPIAQHIRTPAPAICLQQSRPTGIGASPLSAWPKHTRRAPRPPTCTSSPGARRSSTDSLARAMGLRLPSSSTRWAMGLSRCWETTLHNSSPTPCTPPGLPLLPVETPVGRSTSFRVGQPCASTQRQRSWTILDPRSGHCGKACGSFCYRWLSVHLTSNRERRLHPYGLHQDREEGALSLPASSCIWPQRNKRPHCQATGSSPNIFLNLLRQCFVHRLEVDS